MHNTMNRFLAVTYFLTLSTGCVVGPDYQPPVAITTESYHEAKFKSLVQTSTTVSTSTASVPDEWWKSFNDPTLNQLIESAVLANRDVQIAVSRVKQARAARQAAVSSLFPEIDLGGGYFRGKGSSTVDIPLAGSSSSQSSTSSNLKALDSSSTTTPAGPVSPLGEGGLPGVTTNLYQLGFDSRWELDLFARDLRLAEAAGYDVQAVEEAKRGVLLSLLGDVSRAYFEYRLGQNRIAVAQDSLKTQQDILRLIEVRFKAGLVTELDVARQRSQVASTIAGLPPVEATTRQALHQLAYLTVIDTTTLEEQLTTTKTDAPSVAGIPVGLPSELLRRRPDIRQAERQLASETAQTGAAIANLYPSFSLTGAVGFDTSKGKNLFEGKSYYFSYTPGFSWPVLDWGRTRAAIDIQKETQQQAFLLYQNTVQSALREVEDALVQYSAEVTREQALTDSVQSSQRAFDLAKAQYVNGVVDQLSLLDVQRGVLANKDADIQSVTSQQIQLVSLYKALGGGWAAFERVDK